MTCIVGLVDNGNVWIGSDSAGVDGRMSIQTRADAKVFHNGDFLFGFTSSFRMGQLLRHAFVPPDRDPRVPIERYLSTTFIDGVRGCLKAGGYASKREEVENGGNFLLGYCHRLFQVEADYQVGEVVDGYAACGCGEDIALGSLFSTAGQTAQARIETALRAAERFSAGVRGPFKILNQLKVEQGALA